jgi:hypothetical protein
MKRNDRPKSTTRPTAAQRRALKAAGLRPEGVYIRHNPTAPKGRERVEIKQALLRTIADRKALLERKAELIAEFLRTDPDAVALAADLVDTLAHEKVLAARCHSRAYEICRDGDFFTRVLAQGDTFADAVLRLSRWEADRYAPALPPAPHPRGPGLRA